MKRLLFLSLVLSLIIFSSIAGEFEIEVIPANTPILLSPSVISGENDQYIDATQSTTYGTITNGPPSGMGTSDLNNRTTLTEASYVIDNPVPYLFEFANFSSSPSGWSLDYWTVAGGYAYAESSEIRTMTTKAYDLSSFYKIQLDFDYASYDTNYIEVGDYRIAIKIGSSSFEYTDVPARTSTTLTAISTIEESTTYDAVTISWQDVTALDAERLKLDNVEVNGIAPATRYRFEAVFRFDAVELDLSLYTLCVVFNAGLSGSDNLDFYIEADDTTPNNLIADNKQTSFSVDVTEYITSETIYLSILDDYRDTDSIQTPCYISAIYLYSPAWNTAAGPAIIYFDTPMWALAGDEVGFHFWTPVDTAGLYMLITFLGLFMIPVSTLYLVKGGRDGMSANKVFYFVIAFMLGWALLLSGIGFV